MKKLLLITCFLAVLCFQGKAQDPLKADAGEDQHFCLEMDWIETTLGGNPTASGGVPPYIYHWRTNPSIWWNFSETDSNPSIAFLGDLTVYVEVIDAAENIAIDSAVITMSRQQINFSGNPQYLQIDHYINKGDSVFLTGNVAVLNPNSTFAWSPCESIVSDCHVSDGFWAKPTVTTVYRLTATDEFDCSETFFTAFYVVHVDEVGIKDYRSDFLLYPNPVTTELNIECRTTEFYNAKLSVFDIYGNNVFTAELEDKNKTLNFSSWANGVYFLKFQINNSVFYKKIIKM